MTTAANPERVRDFEAVRREHWVYAYEAYGGNLLQAARSLNVPYHAYRNQLIAWGIHTPARQRKPEPGTKRHGPRSRRRASLPPHLAATPGN